MTGGPAERHVAVVGLGGMGAGMARTLATAGWHVLGVDPSPAARQRLDGLVEPVDLATAVHRAGVVLLSLPGSEQVEQVLTGPDGLLDQPVGRRLVIDTSTSAPASTRRLAGALAGAGHVLLDAPVSGGPAGAAAGTLTVFLGGDDDAVAAARPVLDVLARTITHVGGPGAGNVAKLVNNLLCATHLQIAGEALRLSAAAGLDPARLIDAVNGASGRSAVTENNLPTWVLSQTYDSGFTLGLMARDVTLAAETAQALDVELPLATAVRTAWQETRDHLGAGEDFNRMAQP